MKKKIIILFITLILIMFCIGAFFLIKSATNRQTENVKPAYLDKIDKFDYILKYNSTELLKEKFNELKNELSKEEINYENYGKLIAEMYIIDLYTISNKDSKYDVGGSEYVLPEMKDNYELKVRDTLYRYVEDNTNNKRNQELPTVTNTAIKEISNAQISIDDKEVQGYEIKIEWDYEKDMEYDTKALLKLVKIDDKLYVFKHQNGNF